jgi:aminopeptidase
MKGDFMVDPRVEKVADFLVNYSAKVKEGDKVYLSSDSLEALPWFVAVRNRIIENGAFPYEHFLFDSQGSGRHSRDRCWMKYASGKQLQTLSEIKLAEMRAMDAYIGIGGESNTKYLADIDTARITMRKRSTQPIDTERLTKRWVVTRYPTAAYAQEAGMSTEEFSDFVYGSIIGIDWNKQKKLNQRVKKVFDNAKEVRIIGKDTDLTFSLDGREGVCDNGEHNMPGGEVFYAPIHTSLRGRIRYSYPVMEEGKEVDGIYLEFDYKGKIAKSKAVKNQEFLSKMIETDEGSHYIGEFGIGNNGKIDRYMKNVLFDEKIGGTVHTAIGRAYEENVKPNDPHGRNLSAIHWDIVKDLRPQAGGGEIIVDGKVVQKDGEWTFAHGE